MKNFISNLLAIGLAFSSVIVLVVMTDTTLKEALDIFSKAVKTTFAES